MAALAGTGGACLAAPAFAQTAQTPPKAPPAGGAAPAKPATAAAAKPAPATAANAASATGVPMLAETDPQAVGLGYKADTTKVDRAKYPQHNVAQVCGGCNFYQGKATDAAAPCQLFPGRSVAAKGWCTAYVKKA